MENNDIMSESTPPLTISELIAGLRDGPREIGETIARMTQEATMISERQTLLIYYLDGMVKRIADLEATLRVFAPSYAPWMARYTDTGTISTPPCTISDIRQASALLADTEFSS